MRLQTGFLIVVVLLSSTADADIYKCVSPDGVVKYSDEPCSKKAEVAFKTDDKRFDDIIGNASPYPKLPIPSYQFDTDDLKKHAKKIGKSIITGYYNNRVKMWRSPDPVRSEWYVELFYGPEDQKELFQVTMRYRASREYDNMYVWLHSFHVQKSGKPYAPESMAGMKGFLKSNTASWTVRYKSNK